MRNVHCSNCGDTRGGPMGHEIDECTWDSKAAAGFGLPTPGRERLYGRFDGIPPQAATQRNIANRRRVIE